MCVYLLLKKFFFSSKNKDIKGDISLVLSIFLPKHEKIVKIQKVTVKN